MSGVVSAIGNALGDVAEMVGDVVSEIGGGFKEIWDGTTAIFGTMTGGLFGTGIKKAVDAGAIEAVDNRASQLGESGGKSADAPDNAPGGNRQGDGGGGGGTLLTGGEEEEKKNPMKKTLLGE